MGKMQFLTKNQIVNKLALIITLVFISSKSFYSQWGDCDNSTDACTNPSFNVTPSGFGLIEEFTTFSTISNPQTNPNPLPGNMGCLLAGELNSTWLLITVSSPGTLEFSMGTAGTFSCYDWIMWPYDPNLTCTEIQNNNWPPVACNWNGACGGITGMANPGNLPVGADPTDFENGLNVIAGEQFMLCFSNFSASTATIPLDFYGTAGVSCGNAFGTTICAGDTAIIYANMGINYIWDITIPGFIGTNAAGDTAYVNPTVTTSYPVDIDFGIGSLQNDTAVVVVMPFLNASAVATPEVCLDSADGTITISTTAGQTPFTYSISGPNINTSNQTGFFDSLEAGTYTINIIDDFGCTDQITTIVDPGPFCCSFSVEIITDTVNCIDDCSGQLSIELTNAIPPLNIEWYSVNNFGSVLVGITDTISNLCAGDYSVIVSDSTLCPAGDTVNITSLNIYPNLNIMEDTSLFAGLDYYIWAYGNGNVNWTPSTYLNCTDCDTSTTVANASIQYIATLTDSLGCKTTDTINVEVIINPLFVPSGFSPNGDGNNDLLKVIGGGIQTFRFSIMDKWGNVVFESTDISQGWDGTFKGVELPTDVFVYVVEGSFTNFQPFKLTGNVTLFR